MKRKALFTSVCSMTSDVVDESPCLSIWDTIYVDTAARGFREPLQMCPVHAVEPRGLASCARLILLSQAGDLFDKPKPL